MSWKVCFQHISTVTSCEQSPSYWACWALWLGRRCRRGSCWFGCAPYWVSRWWRTGMGRPLDKTGNSSAPASDSSGSPDWTEAPEEEPIGSDKIYINRTTTNNVRLIIIKSWNELKQASPLVTLRCCCFQGWALPALGTSLKIEGSLIGGCISDRDGLYSTNYLKQ